MKTKQIKTIGLLVVVIVIWGYLIYKVIASLNPSEEVVVQNVLPKYKNNTSLAKQDHFELFIPNRDPFLNIVLVKPEPKPVTKTTVKPKNTIDQDAVWSGIAYKGMIAKKNSNETLYLIKINNSEVFLKPNQTYQDYKLIKADKEKISLKYKEFQKTFPVIKNY